MYQFIDTAVKGNGIARYANAHGWHLTIAGSTGTSRTTLDRLFAAEMGHSAGKEILRQRLLLSTSLLKNRTLSLSDIATSCGLCNQAYLTNLFKKHMGTTPTKWRSAHSV